MANSYHESGSRVKPAGRPMENRPSPDAPVAELPRVGGLHDGSRWKRRCSGGHSPYSAVDLERRTGFSDPQVFSGAVFGDHCSPLSDTTIVYSIACGIEPLEHVRTQLPYALLAAAALIGFLPAGFGLPAWLLLPAGFGALALLPAVLRGGSVA